jgi:hypothetical protein
MILSDDRQNHFAHLLIDGLWGDEFIDFDEDSEEVIIREAKRLVRVWVAEQGDIDEEVRKKINSLKRDVPEGSSEWKVMYNKYYNEEMSRRGHK